VFAQIVLATMMLGTSFHGSPRSVYNTDPAGASLKGLKAVYVSLQYDAPPQPAYGLAKDDLRSEVELTLKVNGIRPLKEREWNRTAGKPYLFVHIVGNPLNPNQRGASYFYSLSVELIQQVGLQRKPKLRCEGVTWSEAATIVLPHDKLRTIAVQLQNLTSDFSRAVEEANLGNVAGL
jgi:hypothetical protein